MTPSAERFWIRHLPLWVSFWWGLFLAFALWAVSCGMRPAFAQPKASCGVHEAYAQTKTTQNGDRTRC